MGQPQIVLLSGPICSGKSTLTSLLSEKFAFHPLKTTQFVLDRKRSGNTNRRALQLYGQRLDNQFKGHWLVEDISKSIHELNESVIIDSVRTKDQIDAIREAYYGRRVVHVHLHAPPEVLAERYAQKFSGEAGELASYEDTQRNRTEKQVSSLDKISDISINTNRCNDLDVFERVASLLGLYGGTRERLVDVLIGGQYGSEGKGNVAAYLAPEYQYLVRVGGPNAGHQVKTNHAGEVSTFRQLPSGTRSSDAKLVIGPGAVIDVEDVLWGEIINSTFGVVKPHATTFDL